MSVTDPGTSISDAAPALADAPVVELRQYTLRPGARETLVELFEREFVESQEALGMRLAGLFRDRDDPDRFVWMRAFASMAGRRDALSAFYSGPVWAEHGPAANATMIDCDDVLLLRPTVPTRPPLPPARPRAGVERAGADADGPGERVVITTYPHQPGAGSCAWFAGEAVPAIEDVLRTAVAAWRTEPAPTFPALPVRSEHVITWMATFRDAYAAATAMEQLEQSAVWSAIRGPLETGGAAVERRWLVPTARSQHAAPGSRH